MTAHDALAFLRSTVAPYAAPTGPVAPAPTGTAALPTAPHAGANGRREKRELLPVAYAPTDVVTYIAPNEKRMGTDAHKHYSYYALGAPVHTYLHDRRMPKGQGARCIAWDIARGFIRVTPVTAIQDVLPVDLRS